MVIVEVAAYNAGSGLLNLRCIEASKEHLRVCLRLLSLATSKELDSAKRSSHPTTVYSADSNGRPFQEAFPRAYR